MQEALRKHGLRSIRGKVVHTLEEVRSFWQELSVSHVVIKPVSGAGTGGGFISAIPWRRPCRPQRRNFPIRIISASGKGA